MNKKRCSTCGKTKPTNQFYRNKRNRNGLQNQCKDCEREYNSTKGGKERKKKYANKLPTDSCSFDF